MPIGAAGACTLSLTLATDMFPSPVAFHAQTVMFAQLPAPTFEFRNVSVVLDHTPFMVTL